MRRLVLHNLGPVKACDINVNDFMVFTGPQASGKSTIAKAIFFFRTVKDEIWNSLTWASGNETAEERNARLITALTRKLIRLFFNSSAIPLDLEMTYYYNETTFVSVKDYQPYSSAEPFQFVFSDSILDYLKRTDSEAIAEMNLDSRENEKKYCYQLFNDNNTCLFIPAGRSMISLMASRLSSLFADMDDRQKTEIDYTVQFYLNTLQSIRFSFKHGIEGLMLYKSGRRLCFAEKARKLTNEILKGRYQSLRGEERLWIGPEKNDYILMNQASSGQQEAVWVTNIVFYYITGETPISLIVEEPESNLYPDTQKKMTELLSLFRNAGNQVLITTHSPYVLGTLNNLIYASDIADDGVEGVENVIDRYIWLNRNSLSAWHMDMKDREPKPATEPEMGLIRNEYIEGASEEINREGDKLYEISAEEE